MEAAGAVGATWQVPQSCWRGRPVCLYRGAGHPVGPQELFLVAAKCPSPHRAAALGGLGSFTGTLLFPLGRQRQRVRVIGTCDPARDSGTRRPMGQVPGLPGPLPLPGPRPGSQLPQTPGRRRQSPDRPVGPSSEGRFPPGCLERFFILK